MKPIVRKLTNANNALSDEIKRLRRELARIKEENTELIKDNGDCSKTIKQMKLAFDDATKIIKLYKNKSQFDDEFVNNVVIPLATTYTGQCTSNSSYVFIKLGEYVDEGLKITCAYGARIGTRKDKYYVGVYFDQNKCFHLDEYGYPCKGKLFNKYDILGEVVALAKLLPTIMTSERIMIADIARLGESDGEGETEPESEINPKNSKISIEDIIGDAINTSNNSSTMIIRVLNG
jgi:hypothetical protein